MTSKFYISENATKKLRKITKDRTVFFIMSSEFKDAYVVDAYSSYDKANEVASALGACIRIGIVVDKLAVTL